jgi:hypothetical protein
MARFRLLLPIVLGLACGKSLPSFDAGNVDSPADAQADADGDGAADLSVANDVGSPTGGPCTNQQTCQSPWDLCQTPRERPGGGGDGPPGCIANCTTDEECSRGGSGYICLRSYQCALTYDQMGHAVSESGTCEPGCAELPCVTGESCQPDGRCVQTSCHTDQDCPPNFQCGGLAAPNLCQRRYCLDSAQCQGACVNSACYPMPGRCGPPAE